ECDDGNSNDTDGCSNACKIGFCGDHIVQAANGEHCDDGNNTNGDGCSSTCQLQEICTDQIDNDGDGKIDCDDPDCACLVVTRVCEHLCPAKILFKPNAPDKLRFQVAFDPHTLIDPSLLKIAVTITNANGIVYAAALQPGDMKPQSSKR